MGTGPQRASPSGAGGSPGGTGGLCFRLPAEGYKTLMVKTHFLKTAHSDGPDGLVLLLTVPKTQYTNINLKPYKLHTKLNVSLGSDAPVGRSAN